MPTLIYDGQTWTPWEKHTDTENTGRKMLWLRAIIR